MTAALITFRLLLSWFATAWWLMWTVSVAHSAWWHAVPPMGYETALVLSSLFIGIYAVYSLEITVHK